MHFADHIQTERLSLSPMKKRDIWFFCRLVGNSNVRRYLGGPVHWKQRLPRFKRYLNAPSHVGVWVARLTRFNQPIGLVELGLHKNERDYEVSYQFDPSYWGGGLASEAVHAVIAHALDEAGLERIISETQSANSASCRLLKSQGMVEIERLHRFGAEQTIFATK
ncbi:GNAT family N-acetyltransferase [Litoreibacter roseus]|uniref:GNAT family N-acetyltransferase n=1 Tax=Litoreibacter roseus TaxID=2601869 RepID=UPI00135CE768|nr:GNAT family N-acetyltransferase [Litoreibacter roseus]